MAGYADLTQIIFALLALLRLVLLLLRLLDLDLTMIVDGRNSRNGANAQIL
jgi:hypothetical protein